jgi:probable F420-dependent oxidoreductase
MKIGRVGVWTGYGLIGTENAGEAVALAEALGFGTFWLGGAPRLPTLRPLLEATERIVVATGIVSLWRTEPEQLAREFAELDAEFPGRVLLGMGISHPEILTAYRTPLTLMRAFFDALDAAVPGVPKGRRCLAALGPKMLDLSAERSLGTHSYFVPATHTAIARVRLGVGPVVAPEVACVLDTDVVQARATARRYAERYLGLVNYTSNLRRLGYLEGDMPTAVRIDSSTPSSRRGPPLRSPPQSNSTSTRAPITFACSPSE